MQEFMQAPRRQGQVIVSASGKPAVTGFGRGLGQAGEAPCYSHTTGIHSGLPNGIETEMLMIPCLMHYQQPAISIFHGHS